LTGLHDAKIANTEPMVFIALRLTHRQLKIC
jgi:hypothetical protein